MRAFLAVCPNRETYLDNREKWDKQQKIDLNAQSHKAAGMKQAMRDHGAEPSIYTRDAAAGCIFAMALVHPRFVYDIFRRVQPQLVPQIHYWRSVSISAVLSGKLHCFEKRQERTRFPG